MSIKNVCKICRRQGQKLFLKGEKCYSPKCPVIKKSYPPGPKGKRRRGRPSEYSRELREKQRLKNWYGLSEKKLRGYVTETLKKQGQVKNLDQKLIQKIERRLDNIVFRMGFSKLSRKHARQLVSHSFFEVNGKKINAPSFEVNINDVVSVREGKKDKPVIKEIRMILKKRETPPWLKVNKEKLEGKLIKNPSLEEITSPADIPIIFGFYSR